MIILFTEIDRHRDMPFNSPGYCVSRNYTTVHVITNKIWLE